MPGIPYEWYGCRDPAKCTTTASKVSGEGRLFLVWLHLKTTERQRRLPRIAVIALALTRRENNDSKDDVRTLEHRMQTLVEYTAHCQQLGRLRTKSIHENEGPAEGIVFDVAEATRLHALRRRR